MSNYRPTRIKLPGPTEFDVPSFSVTDDAYEVQHSKDKMGEQTGSQPFCYHQAYLDQPLISLAADFKIIFSIIFRNFMAAVILKSVS